METVKNANLNLPDRTKEKEIQEVYSNWKKALMTDDLELIEELYSHDFISSKAGGITKNRSEVLTRLAFKDVKYLSWEDTEVAIEAKGQIAILKSHHALNIELYGLPFKIEREIVITFEKDYSKWFLKNIKETTI